MILRQLVWLGFVSIGIAGVLQADTVLLVNSDRLSGEIQKLEDKRLYLKTEYAGVIEIDWSMVQGLTPDQTLRLSMRDGRTVTGTVKGSGEGLQVSSLPPESLVLPQSVKTISKPDEDETFWSRWDGSVELGYSLTRGNSNISQSSVGANTEYESARLRLQGSASSLFSKQPGARSASTHAAFTRLDVYLKPHAFAFTQGSLDRDEAQLLRLRTSVGAGLGWQAFRSRRAELSLLGGLTFTHENYRGDEEGHPGRGGSTGEALLGISLERFEWRHLRFIGRSSLYRSVLDGNRIRVVANAGVRVPVIHHVVWTIRFNEQFDSRSLFSVKKHDYGLISSFGLAF
jgi:putative salt-induced outer membrane protein YdiY